MPTPAPRGPRSASGRNQTRRAWAARARAAAPRARSSRARRSARARARRRSPAQSSDTATSRREAPRRSRASLRERRRRKRPPGRAGRRPCSCPGRTPVRASTGVGVVVEAHERQHQEERPRGHHCRQERAPGRREEASQTPTGQTKNFTATRSPTRSPGAPRASATAMPRNEQRDHSASGARRASRRRPRATAEDAVDPPVTYSDEPEREREAREADQDDHDVGGARRQERQRRHEVGGERRPDQVGLRERSVGRRKRVLPVGGGSSPPGRARGGSPRRAVRP